MAESLKHKMVNGTLWSAIERFSVQGILFVVMIIMARRLTPADYGLVAELTVFIAIAQSLVDSGFSQALIRKQNRSQTDNSTVFYFNIVIGFILYAVLYFCAPIIARFYGQPELILLTRVIALGLVMNSFVVVQRALLTIAIDFKTQAKASLIAALISGAIGITMVYTDFGYWSIVWFQLSNYGITVILLWILSKWRPSLIYSWASFRELFSFGSKLALSSIINTLYTNIYIIIIGKFFKASDLGFYTRAHQFADLPSSNLTGIMQRVTYPVLCSIQNDDNRLQSIYRRFLRASAFVIFPLMLGLSAVAYPLVMVLFKEQWLFTATLLQIICFSMMWFPIHAINLNLLQVKGRSDLFLKLELYKKVIGIAILIATLPFGLIAMCYGQILNSIIALIINTHYTGLLIGVGFWKQMQDLIPTLFYSLSMWGIVLAVVNFIPASDFVKLCVGVIVGLTYFLCITQITNSKDRKEILLLIRRNS